MQRYPETCLTKNFGERLLKTSFQGGSLLFGTWCELSNAKKEDDRKR